MFYGTCSHGENNTDDLDETDDDYESYVLILLGIKSRILIFDDGPFEFS